MFSRNLLGLYSHLGPGVRRLSESLYFLVPSVAIDGILVV